MNKLVLGSAQFGFDYGINNFRRKIPVKEVFTILKKAYTLGISEIDTASSYGRSEKLLGQFGKKYNIFFKIITKVSSSKIKEITKQIQKSLRNIKQKQVYGCLIHNFKYYLANPEAWKTLKNFKAKKTIKQIGFSLYYPEDLQYLLTHHVRIDLVQVPYNIFDQRFEPYFSILKKKQIDIYVRSVFLQGLFFKNINKLPSCLIKIKSKLQKLKRISADNKLSIAELALNFVLLNAFIDKVVIGVDSLENLKDNLRALKSKIRVKKIYKLLQGLKETDEQLILPTNWKV